MHPPDSEARAEGAPVGDVTALLQRHRAGEADALDELLPLVYDELRRLARSHRISWRRDGLKAPGTGSLVHEAYLKLIDQSRVDWQSRAQFFFLASRVMRSLLVDNARHHQRQKRGGRQEQVELTEPMLVSYQRSESLLALDAALERLSEDDARLGEIVVCRFFGGLTVEETAEALDVSSATVKRGWRVARTVLFRELQGDAQEAASQR
ncbi:MAG: ECF-type sigma factor [Acidobacteriota bacterium]